MREPHHDLRRIRRSLKQPSLIDPERFFQHHIDVSHLAGQLALLRFAGRSRAFHPIFSAMDLENIIDTSN
jgi:hypothetical protein